MADLGQGGDNEADSAEELFGNAEDGDGAEDVQLASLVREADVDVVSCRSGASVEEQGDGATDVTPTVCVAEHDSARGRDPKTTETDV